MRRKERLFFLIMLVADMMALSASFVIAYWIRSRFLSSAYGNLPHFSTYEWALWVVVPSFVLATAALGLYRSDTYRRRSVIARLTLESAVLGTLIVLGALYMMKQSDMSRLVLNILAILSALILPAEKLVMKEMLDRAARYRRKRRRWQVLIIGEREEAQAYLRLLEMHPHWGVNVAGVVSPAQIIRGKAASAGRRTIEYTLATSMDWREIVRGYIVDEVIAVAPWSQTDGLGELEEVCAERGLIFRMLVMMPKPSIGKYSIEDLGGGQYFVSLETVPQEAGPLIAKRALDIVGATIGLIACGVVYAWYSMRLRRESPGPVLFPQKRVSQNGRLFICYKFRTMHPDAEQRQESLSRASKTGAAFIKIENDPRVTPTGGWMRKRHLDELPQFWNVLKGEMSIVGPRPSQPVELASYDRRHYRRLSMKPGLTGLFQINGHETVSSFEEVVELDCAYIDEWSIWLDFKIIAKTIAKITLADGW